ECGRSWTNVKQSNVGAALDLVYERVANRGFASTRTAAPSWIARNLLQDRLPGLLLGLDEDQKLGRRHGIGIVAGRLQFRPGRRIKHCRAQIVRELAHDRL